MQPLRHQSTHLLLALCLLLFWGVAQACSPLVFSSNVYFDPEQNNPSTFELEKIDAKMTEYSYWNPDNLFSLLLVAYVSETEGGSEEHRKQLAMSRAVALHDWFVARGVAKEKIRIADGGSQAQAPSRLVKVVYQSNPSCPKLLPNREAVIGR